jgi:uncharacterized membrane protein YphA (DoxX/SURF4 family)
MRRFAHFACFDWSGQAVARPKGIALAITRAGVEAPALVASNTGWSRPDALTWLRGQAAESADMLIGFDFSAALPFANHGSYFPGWSDSPFLFEHEYALPIIPSTWAAYAATTAEHLFPALLVLGLFTRLSATALLIMTLVIQFLVYPSAWALRLTWIAVLVPLVARGGGALSLDRLFKIP